MVDFFVAPHPYQVADSIKIIKMIGIRFISVFRLEAPVPE
jgi:hypothetical protein